MSISGDFPIAFAVVDQQGKIILLNDDFATIFGYDKAELLNVQVEILVPDDVRPDHAQYRADFNKVPRTRRFLDIITLRGKKKDETVIPLDIFLCPIPNDCAVVIVRPGPEPAVIYTKLAIIDQKLSTELD